MVKCFLKFELPFSVLELIMKDMRNQKLWRVAWCLLILNQQSETACICAQTNVFFRGSFYENGKNYT